MQRLHNGPLPLAVESDRVMRSEFGAGVFNVPHNWKEPYCNTRLQVLGRWSMAIESGAGAAVITKKQLTDDSECSGEVGSCAPPRSHHCRRTGSECL